MLSAALDSQEKSILFALLENGQEILCIQKDNSARDSSSILKWLIELLKEKNFSLDDISEWTIGTGPSSFTNLRVISALISGIVFRNSHCKGRGVPCACAIVAQFAKEKCVSEGEITVLFSAPENQIFQHTIDVASGFYPKSQSFITNFKQICERRNPICALKKDQAKIADLFSTLDKNKIPNIYFLESYHVAQLAKVMPGKFDTQSIVDLIYLRPPA